MAMQRNSQPKEKNLNLNMETKNKPAFDEVAQGVARIIFGDENITEMNVRLTRIALERYKVSEILGRPADANGSLDQVPRMASVSL